MSEYQYFEFTAVDRPLAEADRKALRQLSTRAQITSTSFTNSYEWGSFKGDPAAMMRRWFDLHLYISNWGSRRLMIRLPRSLVDRDRVNLFLGDCECASVDETDDALILDIFRDEIDEDDWIDGPGLLSGLAPLRAALLDGDLRPLYLLWLMAVEEGTVEADTPEPLPGLGPMTDAMHAFADVFAIDNDLIEAAAEQKATAVPGQVSAMAARKFILAMPEAAKADLLIRLFEGEPHLAAEMRLAIREGLAAASAIPPAPLRTAGQLRERARSFELERERIEAERQAAAKKREAEAALKARLDRIAAVRRRGDRAWAEVEAEIGRRNPAGYEQAAILLADLQAIADDDGDSEAFADRMQAIRERHAKKGRFLERIADIG